MAQTGHTPGPWRREGFAILDANGETFLYAAYLSGAHMDDDYFTGGESGLDLIAAAPDLLVALERIEEACGFATGDIDSGDYELAAEQAQEARDIARAAIRAARGEG